MSQLLVRPAAEVAPPGAPPLGRRERKAAETRQRILQAAIELFSERGIAHVTVEQITERADVGKGTFFNYFASKEAVLRSFGCLQVERLRAAIDAGEIEGSATERLHQIFALFAGHPLLTPDLARSLYVALIGDTSFRENQQETIWDTQLILAGIIREGQASGEFKPDLDPEEVALFMFGQYFLGMLAWLNCLSHQDPQESVRRHVSLALRGVCTIP